MIISYIGLDVSSILSDQVDNNPNLKWVHSFATGVDSIVTNTKFVKSPVALTNSKGVYSTVLGEFIAMGVLYFSKDLGFFMKN